jgi:hypothetical protein
MSLSRFFLLLAKIVTAVGLTTLPATASPICGAESSAGNDASTVQSAPAAGTDGQGWFHRTVVL